MIDPVFRTETDSSAGVTDAQARKTAWVVATVLLAIAAWSLYRERMMVVAITGGAALALGIAGLILPGAARRFHYFWMRLAAVLGYVNSRVLLSTLYYGLFMPYGFVSRLVRDPLRRRGAKQSSYWIERKSTRQSKEQFERLF